MAKRDWRHKAQCRLENIDPELFFPIGETGPAKAQIEAAKAVCRRCPVIEECLRWALETGQDAGVWGGMSETERRELKRGEARGSINTHPSTHPPVSAPGATTAVFQRPR